LFSYAIFSSSSVGSFVSSSSSFVFVSDSFSAGDSETTGVNEGSEVGLTIPVTACFIF